MRSITSEAAELRSSYAASGVTTQLNAEAEALLHYERLNIHRMIHYSMLALGTNNGEPITSNPSSNRMTTDHTLRRRLAE